MSIPFPNTAGFLLSFHSLTVADAGGPDIGIREVNLKHAKEGREPIFGGARIALGVPAGREVFEATTKWELSYWTQWLKRTPRYSDRAFTWQWDYAEDGLLYEVKLKGAFFKDAEKGASVGNSGALEKTINWIVLDIEQKVDGQVIPYRLPGAGEVGT